MAKGVGHAFGLDTSEFSPAPVKGQDGASPPVVSEIRGHNSRSLSINPSGVGTAASESGLGASDSSQLASRVADIVAGVATIGNAWAAIREAGYCASIAGNRISVDAALFVQYLGGDQCAGRAAWLVFAWATEPPILVRAHSDEG